MKRWAIVAALGLLVSGCGGGSDQENVTGASVAKCLRGKDGVQAVSTRKDDLDLVAEDAGRGGVEVNWPRNRATIAVERSESDAENTEAAYRVFGGAFGGNVDELLHRDGTVVVLYDKSPEDAEREAVESCS